MEVMFVQEKKGMDLDVSPNHSMRSRRKTEYLATSGLGGKLGGWEHV